MVFLSECLVVTAMGATIKMFTLIWNMSLFCKKFSELRKHVHLLIKVAAVHTQRQMVRQTVFIFVNERKVAPLT